jgi:hypothetical protein
MVMIDLDLYYYRINACNYTHCGAAKVVVVES